MTIAPVSDRLASLSSQAVFRVLLQSLARPGSVLQLPMNGGPAAEQPGPGIVPLALAVIGSEVAVLEAPSRKWPSRKWQSRICRATGASPAGIGDASLVAIYGSADRDMISQLRCGSAAAPEDGAKVGLACTALTEGGPGQVTLELSGPGVPGRARLGVDGVGRAVFDALREVNAAFPAGVDVWLVDERNRVAGLPRSVRQAVA